VKTEVKEEPEPDVHNVELYGCPADFDGGLYLSVHTDDKPKEHIRRIPEHVVDGLSDWVALFAGASQSILTVSDPNFLTKLGLAGSHPENLARATASTINDPRFGLVGSFRTSDNTPISSFDVEALVAYIVAGQMKDSRYSLKQHAEGRFPTPPKGKVLGLPPNTAELVGMVVSDSTLGLRSLETGPGGKTTNIRREPHAGKRTANDHVCAEVVEGYRKIDVHVTDGACLHDLVAKFHKSRGFRAGRSPGWPVYSAVFFWNVNDVFGKMNKRSRTVSLLENYKTQAADGEPWTPSRDLVALAAEAREAFLEIEKITNGRLVLFVGGSAADWNVDAEFDNIAFYLRRELCMHLGCPVLDGIPIYQRLTRSCTEDQWHFNASDANVLILNGAISAAIYAAHFVTHVREALKRAGPVINFAGRRAHFEDVVYDPRG
jgi:hypothetical protein